MAGASIKRKREHKKETPPLRAERLPERQVTAGEVGGFEAAMQRRTTSGEKAGRCRAEA